MRRLLLLACTSTLSLAQSLAWAQQVQADRSPAPFKILASDISATATTEIIYDGSSSAGSSELATSPGDAVIFRDEATAASASIINNGGQTRFEGEATAAISQLVANEGGHVDFSENATADNADLVINTGGELSFSDASGAGTSQIASNGSTRFAGRSNARLAAITVNESGMLDFADAAAAGQAQITNNGQTTFGGVSSLEGALLTNNSTAELVFRDDAQGGTTSLIQNNGSVRFTDRASLGGGNLIINEGAKARFEDRSDAGNNLVTASGDLVFAGQSNALDAEIVGNDGATITFSDDASAGNAVITSAADVRFAGRAVAANATITMAEGATVSFSEAADGGAARLHLDAGATFDIAPADGPIGIGSLGGAGDVRLGPNTLGVGNEAERVVFAGTISDNGGQGSIVKRGSGIWNLAGQSAYTGTTRVESGTIEAERENALASGSAFTIDEGASLALAGFDQEIGSLAGAGSVDLATASLATGANGRSTVFSGVIVGTGSLIKAGGGELALTGIGTYSGATRVNAGLLRVDGDISGSTVTVGTAGTLLGEGRVGTTALDGTLIGRVNGGSLTVAGDLTMGNDATTIIELAGDRSGRFDVEGTAFLGGVLLLDPVAGISAGNQYVLFQANTIEGVFVFVEPSLAFLDANLVYGPDVVSLALERNGVEFQSVAETRNQRATALAIEQLGEGNAVYDAVLPLAAQAAQAGFDNLSGEGHANALAALPRVDTLARRTVLGRLRDSSAPAGAWLNLQSSTSSLDDDGNGAGVKSDSHAAVGGVDVLPRPDLRLGVAGHYTDTDLSNAARATQGDVTSAGVVAYGAWSPGPWRIRAGASLSAHDIELGRTIGVGALQGRASSQYSGWSAGFFGEAGYAFDYNQLQIEPYAGISYLYARTNGFNETGAGDANLSSGGSRVSRSDAEIGIRASRTYVLENGIAIRPSVAVAYSRNLDGDTASSHHSYAGSAPFRVSSARSSRDAASVEARLDAQIANDVEAGLFYFGSFSGQGDAHTVGVSVRMKF